MATTHEISLQELPIPPMREILELLGEDSIGGSGSWPMIPISVERFQSMYAEIMSGKQMVDIASFICVNGILPFMYQPILMMSDKLKEHGIDTKQMRMLLENCTYNCRVASKKLTLHMVPSIPNIQALIFAATVAQECASPGEFWTYTSYACRLAQALGLHRQHYYTHLTDEIASEAKMTFFWCYVFDKMAALNFGRAPVLHDYDIDTELPELPDGAPEVMPYYKISMVYVEMARLQERTYVELHSAAAMKHSVERRNAIIYDIDGEYKEWWNGVQKMFSDHKEFTENPDLYAEKLQLEFCFYATICVIHRLATKGVPTRPGRPPYNDACLDAARRAMHVCELLTPKDRADSQFLNSLVHWLFLSYPLTPFFVLFGSVVVTRNLEDLASMEHMVGLLSSFDNKSPAAYKLYRLTKIFHRVASIISQAKNPEKAAVLNKRSSKTGMAVKPDEEMSHAFIAENRSPPLNQSGNPPLWTIYPPHTASNLATPPPTTVSSHPHTTATTSPHSHAPSPHQFQGAPVKPHLTPHQQLSPHDTPQHQQQHQFPPPPHPLHHAVQQQQPQQQQEPAPFSFSQMDWDALAGTQQPLELLLDGNLEQFDNIFGQDMDFELEGLTGLSGMGEWGFGDSFVQSMGPGGAGGVVGDGGGGGGRG